MPRVIGIDLGTTNTAVAVLEGGRPRILEDERGYKVLPSVVSSKGDGRYVVGTAAHSLIITSPDRTVYATKRLIGRRFDSPEVQKVLTRVQYKLRPAADGGVQMEVGDQWMTPTEVAAVVLQVARGIAERSLGDTVSDAVITVPAYFNHAQRKATLEAARLAGLPCERLLNEPTAAALAYGLRKNVDRTVLVFDLGGGTFDVSVLRMSGGIYEILASSGDTFLGGEDFDYRVVDHLADAFQARTAVDVRSDRSALQRVKDAAERAKCELSFSDRTTVVIPHLSAGQSLETTLTRTALESLTSDLVDRCVQIARSAVVDAGLSISDIEEVILVGGQTRMPMVRDAVTGVFGREPSRVVHPEEAVAIGAAVHASNLDEGDASATILLDVTPFDLGIDTAGGMFVPIIARNARIPASEKKVFATVSDNQENVRITVRQGDSRTSAQNELLGEFLLEGLTAAPRLQTKVDVTFRLDVSGVLHVAAVERGTGERKQISIRNFAERATAPQFPDPAKAVEIEAARRGEDVPAKKKGGRASLVDLLLRRGRPAAAPKAPVVAPSAVAPAVAVATEATIAAASTAAAVATPTTVEPEEVPPVATPAGAPRAPAWLDEMVDDEAEDGSGHAGLAEIEPILEPGELAGEPADRPDRASLRATPSVVSGLMYGDDLDDGFGLTPLVEPLDGTPLVDDLSGLSGLGPIEAEAYSDAGIDVSLGLAGGFDVGGDADAFGVETQDPGLALADLFGDDELDRIEAPDPFATLAPAVDPPSFSFTNPFPSFSPSSSPSSSPQPGASAGFRDSAPLEPGPAPWDVPTGAGGASWEDEELGVELGTELGDLLSSDVSLDQPGEELAGWLLDLDRPDEAPAVHTSATSGPGVDEVVLPTVLGLGGGDDTSDITGPVALPEMSAQFLDPDLLASPGLLDLNPLDEYGQELSTATAGGELPDLPLEELFPTDLLAAGPADGFALLGDAPLLGSLREPIESAVTVDERVPPTDSVRPLSSPLFTLAASTLTERDASFGSFVSDAGTRPGVEPPRDRRRPARVRLRYDDVDSLVAEYRENLRRGGAFIRTDRPLPVGRECLFEVGAPGLSDPLVLPAQVTFVATAAPGREAGMGVEYRLDDGARARLERVLDSL